ncbi:MULTISPECIES: hypothetical protein [Rhodococcus]|uniref:Uncharacterized protein n=1 Tax=Rhodococcus oxybenzonivorans TaxID=1990687 RepID=A0AAE4UYY3_9NOCA|nr:MULTISPECIES: hypothetical protein [Rhodococcus]MDV7243461.1 hypothetical protein [Rhodococcus oxybenzonivorans]MDV7265167.1 hypothetical protein [Rhodococcus oxybenzonivorans]MDV7277437.1 hypothetical protein [Rhodococcus oxybenzonivorans]MDV7335535.1 hypothetical protein [Rhodococcus oxybenzonivorans]MDV7347149.1 hypothetical protein [Rhodococcus oxybenzonivorans]
MFLINDPTSLHEAVIETPDVPPGGSIRTNQDGTASILDATGNEVSQMAAPWGYDANGHPIPTHYVVRDGQLIQQVHADADTAYPILTDPPPTGERQDVAASKSRFGKTRSTSDSDTEGGYPQRALDNLNRDPHATEAEEADIPLPFDGAAAVQHDGNGQIDLGMASSSDSAASDAEPNPTPPGNAATSAAAGLAMASAGTAETGVGIPVAVALGILAAGALIYGMAADRGDGRDELGHYADGNPGISGKAEEQAALDRYEDQTGLSVERQQVRATTPDRPSGRYYDGLVEKADGTYVGIEVKSGTATKSRSQRSFDESVSADYPATARIGDQIIKITEVLEIPG